MTPLRYGLRHLSPGFSLDLRSTAQKAVPMAFRWKASSHEEPSTQMTRSKRRVRLALLPQHHVVASGCACRLICQRPGCGRIALSTRPPRATFRGEPLPAVAADALWLLDRRDFCTSSAPVPRKSGAFRVPPIPRPGGCLLRTTGSKLPQSQGFAADFLVPPTHRPVFNVGWYHAAGLLVA